MTEPGDTTPISDEAVAAFEAVYWHEDTAKAREWPIREALAAVAPLLVSAEAERRSWTLRGPSLWQLINDADPAVRQLLIEAWGDRDDALAESQRLHQVIAAMDRELEEVREESESARNARLHLLNSQQENVILGLRAELAEAQEELQVTEWKVEAAEEVAASLQAELAALRAAGGPSDADVMKWVAEHLYFGDWDIWAPIAYDHIPVLPRMALSHLYGRHAERESPFAHCVFCELFDLRAAGGQEKPTATHKPFTDDGVTYCGWDGHEGCGEVWPCSTVRAAAVSGPPSWDQVMERVGQRRLLRAIELSADCTCPPGPLPATYDGPMPVCAIHPPTLEEAHELIDRLRAAAPVGGQAEPSDAGYARAVAVVDAIPMDPKDDPSQSEYEQAMAVGFNIALAKVHRELSAAAPVGGQVEPSDDFKRGRLHQAEGMLAEFEQIAPALPGSWMGNLVRSLRANLNLPPAAAAAVSGEQAQPDGDAR